MTAIVPASLHVDDHEWVVERAWPHRGDVALELSHPDSPEVRSALLSADGQVTVSEPARDRRLPGLAAATADGVVVSHRLGRRAVVRSHDGARFTKVVRPGGAAALVWAIDDSAALAEHVRTPPVLHVGDDHVVLGTMTGTSLLDLARTEDAERAWSDWAAAWVDVARGDAPPTASLHDAAAEVELLRTWARRAAQVLAPSDHVRLERVTDVTARRLLDGEPSTCGIAHRDLHDQQLLWAPGERIGVLDVDTASRAETALDLGNLRAHVTLRRLQLLYPDATVDLARAAVDGVAASLDVASQRVRDHEIATLTRLVGVYAFRPRWRHLAGTLLDLLEEPRLDAEEWVACSTSS